MGRSGHAHRPGLHGAAQRQSMGLMDYNARYYSPILGRFISPDTIVQDPADAKSFDRYAYVGNNPIMHNDPSGHCSFSNLAGNPVAVAFSCLQDVGEAAASFASGNHDIGNLALKATGIDDSISKTANSVHQLNADVANTFHPADPNSLTHYLASARLGLTAVGTANDLIGVGAGIRAGRAKLSSMVNESLSFGEGLGYGYSASNVAAEEF